MRTWLLVLAACGSAPRATEPPPANTSAVTPAVDPAIAAAPLIVRGRATIAATRDGHIGSIEVAAILEGAAPPVVSFISAPTMADGDAIYFLEPEGDKFRVLQRIDASKERDVIAQLAATRGAPAAFASELATFRAAAGKPWSPQTQPAVDAAATVFAKIAWIGMDPATVRAALGEPDEISGENWRYVRHNGESGVIRVLRFDRGRVRAVEIHRTQ
jgi:hypothetical protein